jgi:predicted O-linked N-acetylglucosamine transferase (SPINDLY family)
LSLDEIGARLRAGDPRSALALLQARQGNEADPNALYLTGVCQFELRNIPGAVDAFDRAIGLAPSNANFLYSSALAYEDLGRPDIALERYNLALGAAPEHADALHNRGLLLAKLGRRDEALQSHRAYVAVHPNSARAHSDLADILLSLDRYAEALEVARRALNLEPQTVEAALTAGLATAMLEQFAESAHWLDRAREVNPSTFDRLVTRRLVVGNLDRDLDPRAIRLIRGYDRLQACDWSEFDHYSELFSALIQSEPEESRVLASPPLVFRSLAVEMPIEHRRKLADSVAGRMRGGASKWRSRLSRGDRIRIGYVSPDFGTHPTGILSSPLFEMHDRTHFEVHAFSLSPDDGSEWRREIKRNADSFHELHKLGLAQAQDLVRTSNIDILVDLAGATTGALPELFARGAAPIQVSYLGFPGTSGAGFVDYLLCDSICVPHSDEHGYSESLVRLPDTFWLCNPGVLPEPRSGRLDAKLPEDAFVLYAHHPGQKITPSIFSVWMEILKAVPYAVLWLLEDRPDMASNLRGEATKRGVGGHRLVFASRASYADYRNRIPLADLALDTPVYNGGATTLDALACGIPVLTCMGQGFSGRMAGSALFAAGLDELVVSDFKSYARKVISIARRRDACAALKQRVRDARTKSKLFDVPGRVRQLEDAYREMISRCDTRPR